MFLTFPRYLLIAAELGERLGRVVRRPSRARRGHTGRLDCRPAAAGMRIDRIDDPDGSMRIVRITGAITAATLPCVLRAWNDARAPHSVHIDLADAVIVDLATMNAFEQALDRLEHRQVGIRIVGLDPSHPALVA